MNEVIKEVQDTEREGGSVGPTYEQLQAENETMMAELSALKTQMLQKEEEERGLGRLEELVGSRNQPLYKEVLQKAQMEELSSLSYEKRCELGYLIRMGELAHAQRSKQHDVKPPLPPRFAPSHAGGQVAISGMKTPTTFEMARENAKNYHDANYLTFYRIKNYAQYLD